MAYYCLFKFHLLPSEFVALPRRERAFLVAAAEVHAEDEREREKELRR